MDEARIYKKNKIKSKVVWGVIILLACVQLVITLVPFGFMVLNSFREQFDMLQQGVFHMPDPWIFENYKTVVEAGIFGYFLRSVEVTAITLILTLFIASCAAYPLSRMQFRGRTIIYSAFIAMMAVPMHVTLIPVFKMITGVRLNNSLIGLLGPYVAGALPMSIFILTSFMSSIPKEIDESTEMDGCGKYRYFFSFILPLSKPGLSTLAIYNGVGTWNEFAFANTLIQDAKIKTLPLALGQFKGEHSADIPVMMAVLTLSVLPMIILFLIFQDKLVKGMMVGSVKG